MIGYRREIDGLRAVAVVSVLLFHAGFETFSGGYLGVDVFFVISGYLISAIIMKGQQDASFSILGFYERRARRILPALFLVLISCLPFTWLWLSPGQMEGFGRSLISVVLFVSNLYFWSETDYFNEDVDENPLLHTWSLAVEEQFYIIFPLILILCLKGQGRFARLILISIGLASLALAEHWSKIAASNAFYLLPTRAWELVAGALVAYSEFRRGSAAESRLGWLWSLLGLLLILLSMLIFSDGTRHPSIYSVVPILGTVLIIIYGRSQGIAYRLLTNRLVVSIGLISYSLYLWHQPVFAFARLRFLLEPAVPVKVVLIALAFFLAYVSWRYIERPFRQLRQGAFTRKWIFAYAAFGSLFFAGIGSLGVTAGGFEQRFDPSLQAILQAGNDKSPRRDDCMIKGPNNLFTDKFFQRCTLGDLEGPKVILWGDSHADAIAWELGQELGTMGMGLTQITKGACIPIMGLVRGNCVKYNKKTYDYIFSNDDDILVLMARWTRNTESGPYDNGEGGIESGKTWQTDLVRMDEQTKQLSREDRVFSQIQKVILSYLAKGKKIVLVYPVPEAGWNVPKYVLKSLLYGNDNKQAFSPYKDGYAVSTSYPAFLSRNQGMLSALDGIEHPNLYRVKPHEYLCDTYIKGRCVNSLGNQVLYADDDHLSRTGSRLFVGDIAKIIQSISENTAATAER